MSEPFLAAYQVDGKTEVHIDPLAWPEPAVYGVLLADFAHHVAKAYRVGPEDPLLTEIARIFNAELEMIRKDPRRALLSGRFVRIKTREPT